MFNKRSNRTPKARKFQQPIPGLRDSSRKAFSYYSGKPEAYSGKSQKSIKRGVGKNLHWRLLPTFIAVLAIVACIGYVTVLDTNPRITISGNSNSALLRDKVEYQSKAEEILKSSITNRGKLTINTSRIEKLLEANFPELADVAITVPLTGRRPIIDIVASTPALVITNNRGATVLSESGVARANLDSQAEIDALNVPIVVDDSQQELTLGKAALPANQVKFIVLLDSYLLKDGSVVITNYRLPTLVNELHVVVEGAGYYVKFNMQSDPRAQAGTYIAVRDSLQKQNITPNEYIDVRVDDKAFYK